jgi:hypothetical protein
MIATLCLSPRAVQHVAHQLRLSIPIVTGEYARIAMATHWRAEHEATEVLMRLTVTTFSADRQPDAPILIVAVSTTLTPTSVQMEMTAEIYRTRVMP